MEDPGELRLKILLCLEIERDPNRGKVARKLAELLRGELEAQLSILENAISKSSDSPE